jgi:hypothetical protein
MSLRILVAMAVLLQADGSAVDVSYRSCPTTAVPIANLEQVEILGSCNADRTFLRLSVRNLAPEAVGVLEAFDVEFCAQSVVDTRAPAGWSTSVYGEPRQTVEWRASSPIGIAAGQQVGGFEVVLKPEWVRSRSSGAQWADSTIGSGTTHDCP